MREDDAEVAMTNLIQRFAAFWGLTFLSGSLLAVPYLTLQ